MKGKGKILILLLVCLIIVLSLVMVACNKNKNSGVELPEDPGTVVPGKDINFNVYFYILPTDAEPYATLEIKSGNKIKTSDIPDNPSRNGYKFGGWYKTTSFSPGDEFNPNSVIGKDIKLYAYWIAPFTITFYEDLYDGVVNKTITRYSDETVPQSEIYTPEKTNYEFGGWYLDREFTQQYVYSEHLSNSITLYAKWNSTYAKLQFVTNTRDVKMDSISLKKDQENDLPSPSSIPNGATFDAWCLDKALTQPLSSGKITIVEDTIVYAKWTFDHTHTYEQTTTVFKEANCTEAGGRAHCCSICGYYEDEEVIEPRGHNIYERQWYDGGTYHSHKCLRCGEEFDKESHTYNAAEITTNATCEQDGEKTYTCTKCEATKVEVIPALGHDIDEDHWVYDGENHWHACNHECGEHFDEHAHNRVRDESKDYTATTCGERTVVGWKCSICNADLSDYRETISHTIDVNVWENDESQHWHDCSTCHNHINAADHDYNILTVKAATCSETGLKRYTCNTCGYVKEEVLPKTSHTLKWATDTTSCLTDEQKALCDTYHFRYCTVCHKVFDESKEEHVVDWNDTKNIRILTKPKCYKEGDANVTCPVCGITHYHVPVPMIEHTWQLDPDQHVEGTCLEDGHDHYHCTADGCTATKLVNIPAAHKYELESSIPKTCTTPGTNTYKCVVCNDTKVETIPAGHTYNNYYTNETHHWHICEMCHDTLDYGEHDFETIMQNVPKSCEDEVSVMHRCTICQYYYTETTSGLGHQWDNGTVISEPSCTEPGYIEYTCLKCGKIRTETFGEPLGHSWDEGTITTPPTCTERGVRTYECIRCHETRTESVDALGHDWDEGTITQPPTCIVPGVMTYECHRCHETRTEPIPIIDHDWGEGEVTTAPTCTSTGVRTYECSMCHDTRTEVIPMVPHTYSDEPVINRYPTCTEEGERAFECMVCHQQITEPIPALGHDWDEGSQTTAPTCTEPGVWTYGCKHGCGTTRTEPIAPLGHDYHDEITAPTCTERGYTTHTCARCGDIKVDTYVDALGHSWNDGVITTAPTCTSTGVKTYTCTRCGTTRTETVPMTPHTYGSTWTYLDEEHDALKCKDCGHVKETRAHDYDGYCCKYCHHYLLEKYISKFTTHGATGQDAIEIESEDEFLLFLDYIFSRYITSSKYFKFGGEFAEELSNQGKNLTLMKTYSDILDAYQNKVTMPVPTYSMLWNSGNHAVGLKWYLEIADHEVTYNKFISTDEGEGYGTYFYNLEHDWYEDTKNENLPQQDYYFNDYSSSRTNSFDDFKYKEYTTEFDCVTSDQVVFALEHYMKPVCTGRALSIVNRAKSILREIVDDDMSDYEKVKAIYKWIVSNVTYDNAVLNPDNLFDSTDNCGWIYYASWFAEGALDYGYAVCDGISKAFVILTGLEGIRSVRISSNAAAHAWNKVFIDTDADGVGEWYVVDATWGNLGITGTNIEIYDASHFLISDAQKAAKGCVGDNYLDIEATTTYNYYVTETFEYNSTTYDLVIESAEESQILKSYMLENNTKTTTYKTISIFIVGTNTMDLVPAGVSYVDGMEVTIGNVQGKYYILIIS